MDVTEPPNNAPQYIEDSRMIADTGCIPKVSGSSSDTPLGAPRPGSTPTRMPSSTPPIISAMWGTEMAIEKPCISEWKFSMTRLQIQHDAEPAVRQRDLEQALEHHIERDRRHDGDERRAHHRKPALKSQRAEQIEHRADIHADQ